MIKLVNSRIKGELFKQKEEELKVKKKSLYQNLKIKKKRG